MKPGDEILFEHKVYVIVGIKNGEYILKER